MFARAVGQPTGGPRADPRSRVSQANGWLGQVPEHEPNHGDADEGGNGTRMVLERSRESAVIVDPYQCALDDPGLGPDDQQIEPGAVGVLQRPGDGLGDSDVEPAVLMSCVARAPVDEGDEPPRETIVNECGTVAVLHIGGADHDVPE